MAGKLSVAVTGGTGFVGRAVLNALLRRGVEVATVTRDRRRLSDFEGRVRVLEGDIADAGSELYEVLAGHDVVVHLAWDGLPNYRSLHHFETELPRQYRFLREIVARGLKSLLVTGTCFEYGMQNGELSESQFCVPDNPYGYAKDALRRQLVFLKTEHQFNLTWARLFYMYGEGQGRQSIYSLLAAAIERRDASFSMSGGEQLRDYLRVDQVRRISGAPFLRAKRCRNRQCLLREPAVHAGNRRNMVGGEQLADRPQSRALSLSRL